METPLVRAFARSVASRSEQLRMQPSAAGAATDAPAPAPAPHGYDAQQHAGRKRSARAAVARQTQLSNRSMAGVLRARSMQLWGTSGPARLAEQVGALSKARDGQALDAALNGHDAWERHVLLSALLQQQDDSDPLRGPAQQLLYRLETAEGDTLRALHNASSTFTPHEEKQRGEGSRLRKIYADCTKAAGAGNLSPHMVALALLREYADEGFESGLAALAKGAGIDSGSGPKASRHSARVHAAIANGAVLGMVRDSLRLCEQLTSVLATCSLVSSVPTPKAAAELLLSANEGCSNATTLLQRLVGQEAAAATLTQPLALNAIHQQLSALSQFTWPESQWTARLDLLDAFRTHLVADHDAAFDRALPFESALRQKASQVADSA